MLHCAGVAESFEPKLQQLKSVMETRFGGVFRVILPNGIQQPKVNPVKELITYSEAGFSVPVVFESIKLSAEFAIQWKS